MNEREATLLNDLLRVERVLALSVLVDGAPLAGLVPFVVRDDLCSAVVHVSALARHTKGLGEGAPIAVLVHAPDRADTDARQLARVSLEGSAHPIERGTAAEAHARAEYLARFPDSAPVFDLGDFSLVELRFSRGRLVGGFAQAVNLSPDSLARAARR